jgi:hypothetical protein
MASHQQKLEWWGDRICGKDRIDVTFMGRAPVRIQPEMQAAVEALEKALVDNGYELPIDATGSYSCRKISGTNTWSLHAVPIAIDVDYPNNPVLSYALEPGWGTDPRITMTEAQVDAVAEIVNDDGTPIWKWLGWRTPKADPMHFEIDVPPDRCQPFTPEEKPMVFHEYVYGWFETLTDQEFTQMEQGGLYDGNPSYWITLRDLGTSRTPSQDAEVIHFYHSVENAGWIG